MAGGVRGPQLGLGPVVWLCLATLLLGAALGGKVLVVPVDGSHWLSMRLLVRELAARGHDVVVLVPETSDGSPPSFRAPAGCETELYPVSYTQKDLDGTLGNITDDVFLRGRAPGVADAYANVRRLVAFTSVHVTGCESLLRNGELMGRLRRGGYDAVLTDPFLPCGAILAETLDAPAVFFLRGLPCGLDEAAAQCPAPPSYVPRFYVGANADAAAMTFTQRLRNAAMYAADAAICRVAYARFDALASAYLETDVTYQELIGRRGAVWLMRYDFAFLRPKPQMPNMVLIGGVNCAEPAPLAADLQEFVDGSGDDGFIVFTLGSMVDKMPADLTKVFLDAFRKIPQRVVWRYTGILPDDAPEKVKTMKWLPQNDLLAHPKAKLFLTHGGSHGIYEGICNAVPMVMMPLFGDQPDNVDLMVSRGVAARVSVFDVTTEKLLEALNKVLNDTSYKEKMVKLSAVHLDRPIKPLDLAVFWTEFVMRHKGADHLRPAAHDLNLIQYHSLDTICFLAAILMTISFLALKCCLFCTRKCGMRVTVKKKKE